MPAVDYDKLAPYYDALVRDASDIPFFRALARRAGGPVLELMAGSGRVSAALASDGVDLTCVDSSRGMLDRLEARLATCGATARVACDDITRVDLGRRFRLIFIAFHSFEELVTDDDRRACLANVHRHLDEGGLFACTLHDVPTRLASIGPGKGGRWSFVEPASQRELTLALETSLDEGTGIVSGQESLADAGATAPFLVLPIRFRIVRPAEFAELVREAGFVVESVGADYGDAPYEEGRCVTATWILRRAG